MSHVLSLHFSVAVPYEMRRNTRLFSASIPNVSLPCTFDMSAWVDHLKLTHNRNSFILFIRQHHWAFLKWIRQILRPQVFETNSRLFILTQKISALTVMFPCQTTEFQSISSGRHTCQKNKASFAQPLSRESMTWKDTQLAVHGKFSFRRAIAILRTRYLQTRRAPGA